MTLITSISGIRGIFGDGLDPQILVKYAAAFATWARERSGSRPLVILGRDARTTGEVCSRIVSATLNAAGCDVIDAGLASTPTVEVAVLKERAAGGIVLSASHNPAEWNALKLLNSRGEFLTHDQAGRVLEIGDANEFSFVDYGELGTIDYASYLEYHVDQILSLPFIDPELISRRNLSVVVDGVNSVGGIAVPVLLHRLGVTEERITLIHCEPTGRFAHDPEPLPGNLRDLIAGVGETGADLGIAVDPDVDRLALVTDDGEFLGEELTQVLAAEQIWTHRDGPFVTNLSSSRAIEVVADRHDQAVYRSAVGEANVVAKMKEVEATLGGEGNGGVILPDLHYGRDALIGIAITLQYLAERRTNLSDFKNTLPDFHIVKRKVSLENLNADSVLEEIQRSHSNERITDVDGVKIDFDEGWVHLRKSNTEPIMRVYAEAASVQKAESLANRFIRLIDDGR